MASPVMSTGEFSRAMNRMLGVSVRLQTAMQERLASYFDALNLPIKDDVKELGEPLPSMEEQMIPMRTSSRPLTGQAPSGFAA